jgi:hypothetical protein
MIQMNLSSTNLIHNDLNICNRFADLSINNLDIHQMHLDVLDHLDSETKLWPNISQID